MSASSLVKAVVVLSSLLLAGLSGAEPSRSETQAPRPVLDPSSGVWWTLADSTRCVLVEDHRAPVAGVEILFPGGSWCEWTRRNHGREAFDIQIYDPAGRLRARIDSLGADLRLDIWSRAYQLTGKCEHEDLPALIAIVRDVLKNRSFDVAELRRMEENNRLEWKQQLTRPSYVAVKLAHEILLTEDDPRRVSYTPRPRVSTDVKTLADARDEIIRSPGRMIGFWGDLRLEDAIRLAGVLLPPATQSPPEGMEIRGLALPAVSDPSEVREGKIPKLTKTYFAWTRIGPCWTEPGHLSLMIAGHALGGHFHSRLYNGLRHEFGEVYETGARDYSYVEPGPVTITTSCSSNHAEQTEARLREIVRRFQEEGITEEERSLAVSALSGRLAFARETPAQILDRALRDRLCGFPPDFSSELVRRAGELPLDEVNRFIREFYDPDQWVMVQVHAGKGS